MDISQPLHQIRPLKGLGQNFLADKGAVRKIIGTADIKPDEVILEIGPGTGALTLELAKKAKKVIAVEKDAKMCEILRDSLGGWNVRNVEVVWEDILKYKIPYTKHKVVANLPFYLTAPVIRKFLELKNPPKEMVLVVQKEVGQRICVRPPDMNLLAVSVQFYAEPKIIDYISRKSFWPKPKVDSAIIKIVPKTIPKTYDRSFLAQFFQIVKAGFSHPRKQIINNLSTGLSISREQVKSWLQKNKISPKQRAETLTIENWIKLAESL